jgi:two-component system nitrogen regulation response regulator GlnG/two-component system response regulator HydG
VPVDDDAPTQPTYEHAVVPWLRVDDSTLPTTLHLKHDLLARFATRVEVPGLDARRSDIPLLIAVLLERMEAHSPDLHRRFFDPGEPPRARIDPVLIGALLRNRYTHHTRELERLLAVSAASSPGDYLALTNEVAAELASPTPRISSAPPNDGAQSDEVPGAEALAEVLNANKWNVSRTAEQLGVSRHALHRLMRNHGLTRSSG